MAATPEPPEVPPGGLDAQLRMGPDGEIDLRFKCSTGVVVAAGVTCVTIAAMYNKETLKPIIENVCRSVFGACKLALGSLVIEVHCSTGKRVKELLDAYRCGELKRRFLQELRKIGGSVEDLKIKFEVEKTLRLNKSREERILKQGQVKKTEKPEEGTTSMSNEEFIGILDDIRKLGDVKDKIIKSLEVRVLALSLRDEDGRTPLHHAVLLKRYTNLEDLLLECDPDIVSIPDCDGRTVLHLVCIHYDNMYMTDGKMMRWLCKTSINAKDSEGRTPLHYAAMREGRTPLHYAAMREGRIPPDFEYYTETMHNADLVFSLISSGANNSVIDENGKTPLEYAFENDNIKVIELLLEHFPSDEIDEKSVMMKNVNVLDKKGRNILHFAAARVGILVINKLLDSGININAVDNNGMSALDYALAWPNLENVVLLYSFMLEKKSPENLFLGLWKNLETKDSNARTLLHYSVMHFKQNVLEILLERNVNLNEVDSSGMSASHFAAECGNVVALEKLVGSGASVEGKDKEGRTVLHLAASHGDERMVDLLIKKNANVNEVDNKGRSALQCAIKQGNMVAAMKLLEAGASVKGKDDKGQTVLHYAANCSKEELLQLLLKNNEAYEIINDLDNEGKSVLYYVLENAIQTGDPTLALQLVNAGAKAPLVKDMQGKTLLHHAVEEALLNDEQGETLHKAVQENNRNTLNILLQCNLDLNGHDNKGKAALHYAVEAKNTHVIEMLLKAGADVNIKDIEHDFTPLHLAAMRRHNDIIKLLLHYNANPNLENKYGKTAIYYAAYNSDIVEEMEHAITKLSLEDK